MDYAAPTAIAGSYLATMKITTAVSASAAALAAFALGYAVYFDYKRRNDPIFRKKLRKQSKQSAKVAKKEQKAAAQQETMMIEKAVKDVAEPGVLPDGVQEREAFFMEQVATGEALFAQGPTYHVPAAIAFFKALKVYPAPVELVMIYQKAVPKEVFDLIMKLVTRDAAVNGTGASKSAGLDEVDDDVDGKKSGEPKKEETDADTDAKTKPTSDQTATTTSTTDGETNAADAPATESTAETAEAKAEEIKDVFKEAVQEAAEAATEASTTEK